MQELAVVRAGQRIGDRDAMQPHVLDIERDRRRDEPHELEIVGVERARRSLRGRGHHADALAARDQRHAQHRRDRRLVRGQHDEARVLRDVVDQRRLAALDDPAGDAFADRERQRVHPLGAQAVRRLREQALAVGVEQHHRARLRADQLADQLRDPRQQDPRIEVGADQLADLEQRRRQTCASCSAFHAPGHVADERQVPVLLRDVEAVADDELVRDREAEVVDLDLALGALRLVEQRRTA